MSSGSLDSLLRDVSRSFYLTLRVLPGSVRQPIGLAYLLARTTDTIADAEMLSHQLRLRELRKVRERITGVTSGPVDLAEVAAAPDITGGERALLKQTHLLFATYERLSPSDRQRVSELLDIIITGQALDLAAFGGGKGLMALATAEDLDDYTYRVAGCVGEFWTRMCRAHVFPLAIMDDKFLLENGIRFGKGLQLVNILRDIPRDLRNNRCYLPEQELAKAGLRPADLLIPANEPSLRPVYNGWLAKAEAHLKAGWEYTNALPRSCVRVRLACAWPILIGLRTLERLKTEPVLDPERRIKVPRAEVRKIMARSVFLYPFSAAWQAQVPG